MTDPDPEWSGGGLSPSEEEVVRGDTGSGGSGGIVVVGGSREFKRKRSHSLESPERMGRLIGGDAQLQEFRVEIMTCIEELRDYSTRALPQKDRRHEKYIHRRLDVIEESMKKLVGETIRARQTGQLAGRMMRVDKALKKWEDLDMEDFVRDKMVGVVEEAVKNVGQVALEQSRLVQEQVRKEVADLMQTMVDMDEQRGRDFQVLERRYEERVEGLKAKVEELQGRVKETGTFMSEVKVAMSVVNTNVCKLGETMESVPWNSVEDVGRKLEVVKGVDVAGVKEEITRMSQVVREVSEAVKVREGERMEVDEDKEGEPSFSDVVKRKKWRSRTSKPQVVLQVPTGVERKKREEVAKLLDAREGEVRVSGLWRQGRDFVVEVHGAEDVDKLRGSEKIRESGIVVNGEPKRRSPTVTVYNVDKEVKREELLRAVWARNKEVFEGWTEEEASAVFVPQKIRLEGRGGNNWVVAVAPRVFRRLVALGRLYVGLRSCRVEEYLEPLRCSKCVGFGHMGYRCGRPVVCARCGEEGHHVSRCTGVKEVKCVNCIRMGYKKVDHSARWLGCPVAELERAAMARHTKYDD